MPNPYVLSVNIGGLLPNPHNVAPTTGFHKQPVSEPVYVTSPDVYRGESGLAGDSIGDREHHGGTDKAVYCYQREDLDRWGSIKGVDFPNGGFGENLTTVGVDLAAVLVGERWQIGETLLLEATMPRIPCKTFSGIMGTHMWLKEFTLDKRPGTYFKVIRPGFIAAGDEIQIVSRPPHEITIQTVFLARTIDRSRIPEIIAAAEYLPEDLVASMHRTIPADELNLT